VIARRRLLGLTAAAAGAVAFPPLATALRRSVALAPDILTNDVFPIGFFWPPPKAETTVARYKEIADAGFTWVTGGNDVAKTDTAPLGPSDANTLQMRAAEANGLAALPVDARISNAVPCPGWQDRIASVLAEYQGYSNLAGLRIADEPSPVHYPRFGMISEVLDGLSPQSMWHFNLRPVYGTGSEAGIYREHVSRYVHQVRPSFISFDHYPLLTDGTIRPTYFLNWALIREAGLAAGLPTWFYVQAVGHGPMKEPTESEMWWNITTSLAYGCKGIQYFTYWSPGQRPDYNFGPALIAPDASGVFRPTHLYRWAQNINLNFLRPVGRELKHLISESVVHAIENPLPIGTTRFTATPWVASVTGNPVILGQFRRPGDESRRWLLVTNRSYGAASSVTVTPGPSVGRVLRFVPGTGYQDEPGGTTGVRVSLPAGRAALFQLLTGAP
jgi:hypothetical protein